MFHHLVAAAVEGAIGGLVAALLFVAPAVYAAGRSGRFDRVGSFPVAVTVAVTGVFVAGLVDLLVGWIPVVGPFASPLAWAAVVKYAGGSDWPPALLLGGVSWLLTVAFFAALGLG
ncbi:hypothetical protein ACFQMA_19435 [Halosimplex aquaticum]|uniref:Uncharacterized protein n=1 Tax=Halosimplex aquaticum TaxID=3026162 RepID=A0ABD5Y833_9EURY|nr:hypothetical protein [Halosimplex aquaticum]